MAKKRLTQEKLKIAQIGAKHVPSREGGVEIVVGELATRMAAMGHEVTCYNRKGHHVSGSEYDGRPVSSYQGVRIVPVWTIDRRGFAALTSSVSASFAAAFGDYDVVHYHAEGPAFMCWLPKLFGKRIIVTVHGLDHRRAKWGKLASAYIMMGERMAVRRADEIIVLSRGVQQYFETTYHRQTRYIPNGVTAPVPREAGEITARYGLKKDGYILFLGRIVPEKGLRHLIQAFRNVRTQKKLVIVGGSSDTGIFLRELKEMAEGDDRILFTGFIQGSVLDELYSNAYLYVLPSDLEGMPLSLLEAMSYGNCCLVSDIPECAEVVGDKALLFKKGDANDLRDKLQTLTDQPELVARYRQSAREYILAKDDWDSVTRRTLEVYRGMGEET